MRHTWCFLSILFLAASESLRAEEAPLLFYRAGGGLSPYTEITVAVAVSGETQVHVLRRRGKPVDYATSLNNEEAEALRCVVRASAFFEQPEKDTQFVTDVGVTELTVNLGEQHRTLKFSYRPALDPIAVFLWKIIAQAEAFSALEEENLYDLSGALSETDGRRKALQPYKFKQPLMVYLRSATDERKIPQALGVLAPLMAPDEFAGFVLPLMRRTDLKSRLFPVMAGSKSHQMALAPIYLAYLQEEFPGLDDYRKETYGRAIAIAHSLAGLRYEPALPYLLKLFDENSEPYVTTPLTPLLGFGLRGVRALAPRLDDPSEAHRVNAIEMLKNAASLVRLHPPHPNSLPEEERADMQKFFAIAISPKMRELEAKDASGAVREKARLGAAEVENQLRMQPSSAFVTVSVTKDFTLKRTLLDEEITRDLVWDIFKDGQQLARMGASGMTEFRPREMGPGSYTSFVSVLLDGEYRVASNVLVFKIPTLP